MKAHSCHGLIIRLWLVCFLLVCVRVCVHHAHRYPPVFLKLLLMAIYDSVCDLIFIFIIKECMFCTIIKTVSA